MPVVTNFRNLLTLQSPWYDLDQVLCVWEKETHRIPVGQRVRSEGENCLSFRSASPLSVPLMKHSSRVTISWYKVQQDDCKRTKERLYGRNIFGQLASLRQCLFPNTVLCIYIYISLTTGYGHSDKERLIVNHHCHCYYH